MKMINDIQFLKKKLAKAEFELDLSNRRLTTDQIFTKHIASITSEYCGTTEVNLALKYVDEIIQSNWFSNN